MCLINVRPWGSQGSWALWTAWIGAWAPVEWEMVQARESWRQRMCVTPWSCLAIYKDTDTRPPLSWAHKGMIWDRETHLCILCLLMITDANFLLPSFFSFCFLSFFFQFYKTIVFWGHPGPEKFWNVQLRNVQSWGGIYFPHLNTLLLAQCLAHNKCSINIWWTKELDLVT